MNVLALCAGVGGLELGLRLAVPAARAVCMVEGDIFAASVLVARMEQGHLDQAPVWPDLRTFDARPWRGVVDCVTAGFPCQPVSVAGRRRAQDDERWLWPEVARIVRDLGPELVFLENVPGIVTAGMDDVLGDLAGLGFDAEWDLFSAAEAGAPHRRQRWFCLAHADGAGPSQHAGIAGDAWAECPAPERGGGVVVHASGERRGEGRGAAAGPGRAFPPGPGDGDAWRAWVAAGGPEPLLRRGDDGVADRVDRLRACGNGVVPLVAAHAFRTLAARFDGYRASVTFGNHGNCR